MFWYVCYTVYHNMSINVYWWMRRYVLSIMHRRLHWRMHELYELYRYVYWFMHELHELYRRMLNGLLYELLVKLSKRLHLVLHW